MRVSRYQLRQIIREADSLQGVAPYILERSGVSWDERFFVEVAGANTIVYGPPEQAEEFPDVTSAEEIQQLIDDVDGYYTRVVAASFFKR